MRGFSNRLSAFDFGLAPGQIIMRGGRFRDMRSWRGFDPQTKLELRQKAIYKVFGGVNILTAAAAVLKAVEDISSTS